MTDCMFDFRLDDYGQIALAAIGESTQAHIVETCYPELDKAFAMADWDDSGRDYSAKGRERLRAAVELERTRLWDAQPMTKEPETQLGRDIQKQTGAAGALVNRIVREAARKRLESKDGEGKKPN